MRVPFSSRRFAVRGGDMIRRTGMSNAHVNDEPVEWPIDGVLDLHLFRPGEVKDLVPAYLEECRARGIWSVRIIHGKGTGALRATVHAILERMAEVDSFSLAPATAGGWGATVVKLKPHQ